MFSERIKSRALFLVFRFLCRHLLTFFKTWKRRYGMSKYGPPLYLVPMCPNTVTFSHSCSPAPPGNSGNSGILGIVVRNVFALRQNHFHGLGNYWKVLFSPSCSPALPGNSGCLGRILGILVRNVFALRQNQFHGLGNYWEVIFTQGKVVYQRVPHTPSL